MRIRSLSLLFRCAGPVAISVAPVGPFAGLPLAVASADTVLKLIPDGDCGAANSNEIRVCGSTIRRDDFVQLHGYTDCLVVWQRNGARAALLVYLRTGSAAGFKSLVASDHSCPSHSYVKVSPILLGGALAESLLKTGGTGEGAALATPGMGQASGASALDCLLGTDRPDAVSYMRSALYSKRERVAIGALSLRLSHCLPAGETVRLRPAVFRSAIALHLYADTVPAGGPAPHDDPINPATPAIASVAPRPATKAPDLPTRATPALSIGAAPDASDAIFADFRQRDHADLPRTFDPSDALAHEASPALNADTGETTEIPSERESREKSGTPY